MNQEQRKHPELVTYSIPRIEVYQVTEDELDRIEESTSQVGQDFTFMVTGLSITVSLVIALISGTFEENPKTFLQSLTLIAILVFIYTGSRWFRYRKKMPDVVKRIRSRKVDPKV